MSRPSRRAFLRASLGASAALLATRGHASPARPARPRMLVQFVLTGGIDAILSTDPKAGGEVAPEVDRPYEDAEIRAIGGTRVGPLFRGLERFVPEMAIVNGVNVATVSHETGRRQLISMRRLPPSGTARGLGGALASALRVETPLWGVRFVESLETVAPSGRTLTILESEDGSLHDRVLESLSRLAQQPSRRAALTDALAQQLARCDPGEDCRAIDAARALLARMPAHPLPQPPEIPLDPTLGPIPGSAKLALARWSRTLRDLFFLLENRLSTSAFVMGPENWDTHAWNGDRQVARMRSFGAVLAFFLGELRRRRTIDGALLADEVGVVISSELGRYPILNFHKGKDHLPETAFIFLGPGIRPGQYGATDRYMMAQPISPSTGQLATRGAGIAPALEDVGTTVLRWFGIRDTAPLGYWGSSLDFVFA